MEKPLREWTEADLVALVRSERTEGPTLEYKAAGLIFKSMLAGQISSNTAQWAVWGLFSTNASTSSYFLSKNFGVIDLKYLGLAATASNSAFNGLVLYTPTNARPRPSRIPAMRNGTAACRITRWNSCHWLQPNARAVSMTRAWGRALFR